MLTDVTALNNKLSSTGTCPEYLRLVADELNFEYPETEKKILFEPRDATEKKSRGCGDREANKVLRAQASSFATTEDEG